MCLPKQFRLFPPSRRPLVPPAYNADKQLTSSRPPASFADFAAVWRNKGRINVNVMNPLDGIFTEHIIAKNVGVVN